MKSDATSRFYIILLTLLWVSVLTQPVLATCIKPHSPPAPPPPDCGGCPGCESNCQGSPMYAASGIYTTSATDLQIPTRGFPITVQRQYMSSGVTDTPFGIGWSSNLSVRLYYSTYLFAAPSTYSKEATIRMPNGEVYRFKENPDGTSYTPPIGSRDVLARNPGDGSFSLTLELTRSRYNFSSDGLLRSTVDDYGNALNFTYDEPSGRLTGVSDGTGSGRSIILVYINGRVDSVQDSAGRIVRYAYSPNGTLQRVTDPVLRNTDYFYTTKRFSAPLLSEIRDHWGRTVTAIQYYPYLKGSIPESNRYNRVKTYTEKGETWEYRDYFPNDRVTKFDSAGNGYTVGYNSQGLVTRIDPPGLGGEITRAYNADGSLQWEADGVNVKTSYAYNPNGSISYIIRDDTPFNFPTPVRFVYVYGDPQFPEKVTRIIPKNRLGTAFNRDWQELRYDYHQPGSPAPGALHHVYRVRSDGTTVDTLATYTYNNKGQVLTSMDGAGSVTTYAYNPNTGDLSSVTYPKNSDAGANPVYQYGRDSLGRVTSVTDPLGMITSYTYDNFDRITTVTLPKPTPGFPFNFTTTYTYDIYNAATGLVFTHQTDPNGRLTKQGFDQYGQLGKSIDALNNTTAFTYTKGLLTSITDAHGNITSYQYDNGRRLIKTIFPDGTDEDYTYYADLFLKTKTDRKNQTVFYEYDRLKRLITKCYTATCSSSDKIIYIYLGQKLTTISDAHSGDVNNITNTYDTSYRVLRNTQSIRGWIQYGYAAADRVSSYLLDSGITANYTYYADGNLRTIQWSPVAGQTQYQYTLRGQYQSLTFPNGQHRDYTYDDQGRLLQIANIHPQTGNLATYGYGYDTNHYTSEFTMLGQRSSMTATVPAQSFNNGLFRYYYDGNYQLNRVDYPNVAPFNSEIDSWTYDAIGNRISQTVNGNTVNYTYYKNGANPNNGQRLQSDGTYSYVYDANGNLFTKTGAEGTYTFTWDGDNRLRGISGAGLTSTYSYDSFGRRITSNVNGANTSFLNEGENLISSRGASQADFVFGPAIDEPLIMYRSAVAYQYDIDGLGSANLINDTTGTIQNKYVLDAWGITRSQTAPIMNPFTYTARETAEVGLMYYRARYYSQTIGRFVSEDPLGFKGGMNLYIYGGNYPIGWRDPLGLVKWACDFKGVSARAPVGSLLSLVFDCQSECIGGRSVVAVVNGQGVGASLSPFPLPIAPVNGEVQLDDGSPYPDGYNLVPTFHFRQDQGSVFIQLGKAHGVTYQFGQRFADFYGKSILNYQFPVPCCGTTTSGGS